MNQGGTNGMAPRLVDVGWHLDSDRVFSGCVPGPDVQPGGEPEKLVTAEVAAEHVGITPKSFMYLQNQPGFPRYKIGRFVRFKLTEIEAWAKQRGR